MSDQTIDARLPDGQENPPVFKKWSGWYWLVIAITVVQFLIYFLITQSFS